MQLMLSDTITTPDFKPCGRISILYVQIIYQIAFISWIVLVFSWLFFSSPRTHAVATKRSHAWTRQKVCVTSFIGKLRGPPHLSAWQILRPHVPRLPVLHSAPLACVGFCRLDAFPLIQMPAYLCSRPAPSPGSPSPLVKVLKALQQKELVNSYKKREISM